MFESCLRANKKEWKNSKNLPTKEAHRLFSKKGSIAKRNVLFVLNEQRTYYHADSSVTMKT